MPGILVAALCNMIHMIHMLAVPIFLQTQYQEIVTAHTNWLRCSLRHWQHHARSSCEKSTLPPNVLFRMLSADELGCLYTGEINQNNPNPGPRFKGGEKLKVDCTGLHM
jgi:hypothetical protein